MSALPHLPLLRAGQPYRSEATVTLTDVRTGGAVGTLSLANPGLIAKDLRQSSARPLDDLTVADLVAQCERAAALFADASLPLGDGGQSQHDYLAQLVATTGLPWTLARRNQAKIVDALAHMGDIVAGLTRGLDPAVLDRGEGSENGRGVAFQRQATRLGAVLPSNSPGVHTLWLPAIPLKVELALKPGQREPWSPYRVVQALIAAGCPATAFHLLPTTHDGATQLLLGTHRSLLFGDGATVAPWRARPGVQIHGPGFSKVIVGPDVAHDDALLDLLVESVAANGGRSCLNASSIWVTRGGRALAERLAERLRAIRALPLDHPEAALAAFPEPAVARAVSTHLDRALAAGGAVDLTHRASRLVEVDDCTFLEPTLVWCEQPDHPLASTELLFPFAAVVEVPAETLFDGLGPTLVATVLGTEPAWVAKAVACRSIDRLNLGPIPTSRVRWDQPHEGNLFAHLYQHRALQRVG